MSEDAHASLAPSPWVETWARLICPRGSVLDLACGSGRHARWLARRGLLVDAVDRDEAALSTMRDERSICTKLHDLEGDAWPYPEQRFDGVVVTNYLHRPLFPVLIESLRQGGVLVYETFAHGNEHYGRPTNPAFLLRPGELLSIVVGKLHVVAYEDRFVDIPKPAMVQRICAVAASDSSFVWGRLRQYGVE